MVPEEPGDSLNSRDYILDAIRRNRPPEVPLPDEGMPAAPPGDLIALFEAASRNNTSDVLYAESTEVESLLSERFRSAGRTASTVPDIAFGNLQIHPETDPRTLDPLDVLVCRGEFGVAENGAIWLTDSALVVRAAPFLAEHLIILLDRTRIVANMHDAYHRLQIDEEKFGIFIAGPSKTADIEQSLVVGAQGPKCQTIVLVSGESNISVKTPPEVRRQR